MPTIYSPYSSVDSATTEGYTLTSPTMPGQMHLFMLAPTVVFAGRVNMATATYPLESITFDGVTTGAFGDIKPGMTLLLGGSAGGDRYGRQRIRKAATSSLIYVGRSSQGIHDGELDAQDNAYITVLDDYRVWAKVFNIVVDGATSTTYKDADIAYVDQNTASPPVANTGPGFAGTIDNVTELITVEFNGTTSFATAIGATISTYLWDVGDGTITVGTSASSTITATFPAGFRWVSLTVTDSNGKTHIARCPVYARDPADGADTTIQNWQIDSHRITKEGQQIGLKVFDDISVNTYPDGTLILIWEGEPTDESDRSHMVFTGWHHTDPTSISAGRNGITRDTTLNCLDVAGKLGTLPSFPQTLSREVTDYPLPPWSLMANLNMDRMMHYMFHWHSTALDVSDWQWMGVTYNMFFKTTDAGSLWEQISKLARAVVVNRWLTCNTLGQLRTLPDPILQNTADRTATIQAALDEDDYSDIRFTHQRPAAQHWLRGSAVLTGTSLPLDTAFCVAPGNAPGQGEQAGNYDFQLAQSQDDLNDQEGHRYARVNARDSNYAITLTADSDLGIEPANMTWVSLDMDSALVIAQRGGTLTAARGLVHNISIRYDYQRGGWVRTVELDWELERSSSSAAVTDPHPINTGTDPEFELPADSYTPPPGTALPGDTPTGLGTVYAMSNRYLFRTLDLSATSPAWVSIGPTPITSGLTFKDFILDPWRPHTHGYLATQDGVYLSEDLDTTTPTWNNIYSPADILADTGNAMTQLYWCKLLASPNQDGYLAFIYETDTGQHLWCSVTTNAGASWSTAEIPTAGIAFPGGAESSAGASDIVPHTVGGSLVLYLAHDSNPGKIYKSVDAGDTWTDSGDFPDLIKGAHVLHCPFDGNEDGNTFFVGTAHQVSGSIVGRLYKSTSGDAGGLADISAVASHGSGVKRTGVETFTQDSDIVYTWVEAVSPETDHTLWLSDDGGSTWTQAAAAGYDATKAPTASSGFPYNGGQMYVMTRFAIYVSTDNGATFVDKTGDWSNNPAGDWNALDGFNPGVLVPDWTE